MTFLGALNRFGVNLGGMRSPHGWWPAGALFDADYASDRYFWNGQTYVDEDALLAAIGGTKSGIARTIGPYVDPAETNILTNGDFSDGTTGWAAGQTGSSIQAVSGELELTSTGSLNGFSQAVNGKQGRAFRFRGTGRRGTTSNSFLLFNGTNAILSSGTTIGDAINSTSPKTVEGYAAAYINSFSFVGVRNTSGSGSGTAYFDNFSLVEVWPFKDWPSADVGVVIEATAPVSASADEVLWQADMDRERDKARVMRRISDKHVVVLYTINNTDVSLDLGEVGDGEAFGVALNIAPLGGLAASLNGGVPVTSPTNDCPAAVIMRIGRSFTGNQWTGSIERVTVF